MASIADSDSLSGIELLDSTATSPLLNAAPITTHPDPLSPASQLSSLRASLGQSSTLLRGSDNQGSCLEDSPGVRPSSVSSLTQSSLEKHNISHQSYSSVNAVSQNQPRFHHDFSRNRDVLNSRGLSSMPSTPYSNRQLDLQPQRLLATADHKYQPHPQTRQGSGTRQDIPIAIQSHQTHPANRQLFSSHSTKTTGTSQKVTANDNVGTDLTRDPHVLNASSGREFGSHHGSRITTKPEQHPPSGQANSLNASLLQSIDRSDSKQPLASFNGMNRHQASQRSEWRTVDSHEKTHQSDRQDFHQNSRVVGSEFQEMDRVRRSLYHMVHNAASRPRLERDSLESKESVGELLASRHSDAENGLPRESLESAKTDSLLGVDMRSVPPHSPHAYQDAYISPLAMDSGLGVSSLRNLSNTLAPTSFLTSGDSSLFAENHMLKDSLEKERYRRKHCEKQIGEVQAKLLETQQQLAVAISTERKKDAMIEQLDKTLARIVDGWRKQEQDKNEALERLANEKQDMIEEMDKLRKAVDVQQTELNQDKERLGSELQQALHLQQDTVCQLVSLQEEVSKVRDQLVSEQKLTAQTQQQRDGAIEERHRLDKQVKQIQHMLAEERQQSQNMRREFQDRIDQFEKEHRQLLVKQKARIAEESRNSELLETRQQEVNKLKTDLDNAIRNKENTRLELTLQQAKSEAAQQKQEAEWQEKLEKLVDERLRELQLQSSKTEAELRESHRKQLGELHHRHQSQLLSQRAVHTQDLAHRDKKIEDQSQQYQSRLEQHHQDMIRMTHRLEKAQQQRSLLVQRLQGVQVYCTDVLSQMTHASPLIKELSSGMEAVMGGGPSASAPVRSSQPERARGTRPQDSPITISVSSPRRDVGAGNLENNNSEQEHEDGNGQEDNDFHLPNLSFATSIASQSSPSNDPFIFHTESSFQPNLSYNSVFQQDVAPVSLSQFFNEPAARDVKVDGFASPNHGQVPTGGVQNQNNTLASSKAPNRKDYPVASSSSHVMQYLSGPRCDAASHVGEDQQKAPKDNPSSNAIQNHLKYPVSSSQVKQEPTQGLQYFSDFKQDLVPAREPEQRKEPAAAKLNASLNTLLRHSKYLVSTSREKQGFTPGLDYSGSRPDAAPTKGSELDPSREPIPRQDLISEGLRMLKMSPPSGHSSPLRDPQESLVGLTLGDVLRVTGGNWDELMEEMRHDGDANFREIQPSLDNTKTTNSVAAYPREDETISELESGSIHPDSSNILLERLAEHKHRQVALQHYIQMLLQQSPGAPPEEPSSLGPVVTKETVGVTNQKGGMTTWHELAPQSHKRGAPDDNRPSTQNTHTNPRTYQVGHTQGRAHQTRPEKKPKINGTSGAGLSQAVDKQASTSKPKGPTSVQSQATRNQRHTQKTTASGKPARQAATSSTTAPKRVVRRGAVRN